MKPYHENGVCVVRTRKDPFLYLFLLNVWCGTLMIGDHHWLQSIWLASSWSCWFIASDRGGEWEELMVRFPTAGSSLPDHLITFVDNPHLLVFPRSFSYYLVPAGKRRSFAPLGICYYLVSGGCACNINFDHISVLKEKREKKTFFLNCKCATFTAGPNRVQKFNAWRFVWHEWQAYSSLGTYGTMRECKYIWLNWQPLPAGLFL